MKIAQVLILGSTSKPGLSSEKATASTTISTLPISADGKQEARNGHLGEQLHLPFIWRKIDN